MTLTLYSHPFSSYCQKMLIALYENETPFDYRSLEDSSAKAECAALWPFGRFPVLVDDGRTVAESSIIIEHLAFHYPGPVRLLPDKAVEAIEVRFLDRVFDNYVMAEMQKPVFAALNGDEARTREAMEKAQLALDTVYAWLEERFAGRHWAAGNSFTMADCSAGPALFYADWVHPIGQAFPRVRAYRSRLLERPSFARAVAEARPFRQYFPLGAPDRD